MLRSLLFGPRWYSSPLVTMLLPGRLNRLCSKHVALWDMYERAAKNEMPWFFGALVCGLTFPFTAPLLLIPLMLSAAGNAVVPQKMRERLAADKNPLSRLELFTAATAPYYRTALVHSFAAWLAFFGLTMPSLMYVEPDTAYPMLTFVTTGLALFIGAVVFCGAFGSVSKSRAEATLGGLVALLFYLGVGSLILAVTTPLITNNQNLGDWRHSTLIINPWLALMAARFGPLALAWLDERDRRAAPLR